MLCYAVKEKTFHKGHYIKLCVVMYLSCEKCGLFCTSFYLYCCHVILTISWTKLLGTSYLQLCFHVWLLNIHSSERVIPEGFSKVFSRFYVFVCTEKISPLCVRAQIEFPINQCRILHISMEAPAGRKTWNTSNIWLSGLSEEETHQKQSKNVGG